MLNFYIGMQRHVLTGYGPDHVPSGLRPATVKTVLASPIMARHSTRLKTNYGIRPKEPTFLLFNMVPLHLFISTQLPFSPGTAVPPTDPPLMQLKTALTTRAVVDLSEPYVNLLRLLLVKLVNEGGDHLIDIFYRLSRDIVPLNVGVMNLRIFERTTESNGLGIPCLELGIRS